MEPASRPRRSLVPCVVAALTVVATLMAQAAAVVPKLTRVSVSSADAEGNGDSYDSSISGTGRYVAFASDASNLVGGDTNDYADVFVRDRKTGSTSRVSLSSAGVQPNADSEWPSISADGRFVAFESFASNVVANDDNDYTDVFVRDRETGKTRRVSVTSGGTEGNGQSIWASISADGRFVAFMSQASNLAGGDTNGTWDVFVHDRETAKTRRVSLSTAGDAGNADSDNPSISADGRFVAFRSAASNLVGGDTNATDDVLVRDRQTGTTTRVSVNSDSLQGNGSSSQAWISGSGRFVVYLSFASNLAYGDTNGSGDIFLHDRQTGTTRRISINAGGTIQSNANSDRPIISADGRFVSFETDASTLVEGDTNGFLDIFVRGPML
jgi:tricorn protease-like protein